MALHADFFVSDERLWRITTSRIIFVGRKNHQIRRYFRIRDRVLHLPSEWIVFLDVQLSVILYLRIASFELVELERMAETLIKYKK